MGQGITVAVAGATGFVGRHVAAELLSRGHRVRALVRDATGAAGVLPAADTRLTIVTGSAPDDVGRLVIGADACVNCIGIIREVGARQSFERLHVQTPRALAEACELSGCRRLVQISAIGAHPWADTEYARSKYRGEQILWDSGLDVTVLRPGLIHGPEGEFTRMCADWARGARAPWKFMPYFTRQDHGTVDGDFANQTRDPRVQPVWVGDVAAAVAEALARPETIGETYNLVGSEVLTMPELLVEIRDRAGGTLASRKPIGISSEFAATVARCAALMGLGGLLPFDVGMARMGGRDTTAEVEKLRAHLGIEPRPFRDALREYADRI